MHNFFAASSKKERPKYLPFHWPCLRTHTMLQQLPNLVSDVIYYMSIGLVPSGILFPSQVLGTDIVFLFAKSRVEDCLEAVKLRVWEAWVGDYDTLPKFISSVKTTCRNVLVSVLTLQRAAHMNIFIVEISLQAIYLMEPNHIIIFMSQPFVCKVKANTSIFVRAVFSYSLHWK